MLQKKLISYKVRIKKLLLTYFGHTDIDLCKAEVYWAGESSQVMLEVYFMIEGIIFVRDSSKRT